MRIKIQSIQLIQNTNIFKITFIFPPKKSKEIIGDDQRILNELSTITSTQITFVRPNHFHIQANSQNALDSAKKALHAHLKTFESSLSENNFTHFLAIPTIGSIDFKQSIDKYLSLIINQNDVKPNARESLYNMHITLGLLYLNDKDSIEKASQIIQSVVQGFNWNYGNQLQMNGINSFSVKGKIMTYYAQPKGTTALEKIEELSKLILKTFKENNIIVLKEVDAYHITIFRPNSFFHEFLESDDLRLELFNAVLPPCPINSIALCQKSAPQGKFYNTEVVVPFL